MVILITGKTLNTPSWNPYRFLKSDVDSFCENLVSTNGPGPYAYGPGPLGPYGPGQYNNLEEYSKVNMLQDHI